MNAVINKKLTTTEPTFFVDSEIAPLKQVMIHYPNDGIGLIPPNKATELLYDDIVSLKKMRKEYQAYLVLLRYFLDGKVAGDASYDALITDNEAYFNPASSQYFESKNIFDVQKLLADVLQDEDVKSKLVAIIGTLERVPNSTLRELEMYTPTELSKVLINGYTNKGEYIFPPIPNLIFTRDIGVVIQDHLLLSKSAFNARKRESIISKHIFFKHEKFRENFTKVIEKTEAPNYSLLNSIEQERERVTIEGGDIMIISPKHLLIGCSERTSESAVDKIIRELLVDKNVVEKVTVVQMPCQRDYMHFDTIMTQVSRDTWVLFDAFDKQIKEHGINRHKSSFINEEDSTVNNKQPIKLKNFARIRNGRGFTIQEVAMTIGDKKVTTLEDLAIWISENDFDCNRQDIKVIRCGQGTFPFDYREQWTDACNVLALKEGVVIGYDRNEKTQAAFEEKGFETISAMELINSFRGGARSVEEVENMLIMLPSCELSRARGGSHCMSFPIKRKAWNTIE